MIPRFENLPNINVETTEEYLLQPGPECNFRAQGTKPECPCDNQGLTTDRMKTDTHDDKLKS